MKTVSSYRAQLPLQGIMLVRDRSCVPDQQPDDIAGLATGAAPGLGPLDEEHARSSGDRG